MKMNGNEMAAKYSASVDYGDQGGGATGFGGARSRSPVHGGFPGRTPLDRDRRSRRSWVSDANQAVRVHHKHWPKVASIYTVVYVGVLAAAAAYWGL